MSSIFSKIIAGEIPCYKIYEDDKTFAFLDINPESPGHTLVVPKVEIDKIYDLPDEDYQALMATAKKIAKNMEDKTGKRTIWKVIGVDVPHAHIHLCSYDKDWHEGRELKLSEAEMESLQKELAIESH